MLKRAMEFAFAILLAANISMAAERPKHIYYLNSGISFPTKPGEFPDHWTVKPNIGFGIGHSLTTRLTLIGHFGYNRFDFKRETDSGEDGDLSILAVMAGLRINMPSVESQNMLYLVAGTGYFRLASDAVLESHPWSYRGGGSIYESNFALFFGTGIDFQISKKATLFIELGYAICLSIGENTQFLPIKMGISFEA